MSGEVQQILDTVRALSQQARQELISALEEEQCYNDSALPAKPLTR